MNLVTAQIESAFIKSANKISRKHFSNYRKWQNYCKAFNNFKNKINNNEKAVFSLILKLMQISNASEQNSKDKKETEFLTGTAATGNEQIQKLFVQDF